MRFQKLSGWNNQCCFSAENHILTVERFKLLRNPSGSSNTTGFSLQLSSWHCGFFTFQCIFNLAAGSMLGEVDDLLSLLASFPYCLVFLCWGPVFNIFIVNQKNLWISGCSNTVCLFFQVFGAVFRLKLTFYFQIFIKYQYYLSKSLCFQVSTAFFDFTYMSE